MLEPPIPPPPRTALFLRTWVAFSMGEVDIFKTKKNMEKYPTCYVHYVRYFRQTFPFATCLALEERPQEMQFFKKPTSQNQQR